MNQIALGLFVGLYAAFVLFGVYTMGRLSMALDVNRRVFKPWLARLSQRHGEPTCLLQYEIYDEARADYDAIQPTPTFGSARVEVRR